MSSPTEHNARELELLLRAVEGGEFQFILVRLNHLGLIDEVVAALRARFPDRPLQRLALPLPEGQNLAQHFVAQGSGFLVVQGFDRILDDDSARVAFNQRRDRMARVPAAMIACVWDDLDTLRRLQRGLPDVWSIRNLEVELHRMVEARHGDLPSRETDGQVVFASKEERDAEIAYLRQRLAEAGEDAATAHHRIQLHLRLGRIYRAIADYDAAREALEAAKELSEVHGDQEGLANALNSLGLIHDSLGEYEEALKLYEKSLALFLAIGDRSGESAALNNISQIHDARGDYDTALQFLEQSLKIRQEVGDRSGEGVTLNNISQIHAARGDYETALQFLEQSLKIQQEIGDRSGEGTTLNNIGQIRHARGDYETALQFLEQSLKIRQKIGDRNGEGGTLSNIGVIHHARGDYDTALRYLKQSLKIQLEIGDRSGEATTLHNIGSTYSDLGQYETALPHLLRAKALFQRLGSPTLAATEKAIEEVKTQLGEARSQQIIDSLQLEGEDR